jgi:hypothetical protein
VQKARVDVVPRNRAGAVAVARRASAIRKRPGPFGLTITGRVRLELGSHGLTLDLLGADPQILDLLSDDLERTNPGALTGPVDVARVYGESGGGAHDPRTHARVGQLKDALKGKLEPLLEAWREKAEPARSP